MFEQQQDTGKSASLAKKYANVVAQLSDSNDRAARAEHGENGAFPPTRDGCIHSLSMRERG